jgi:hypothetical protein
MIQTVEAVIDERGQVYFPHPVTIKGVHRALVTILDEPPVQTVESMSPVFKGEIVDSEDSDELFGIWKDYPETASVDEYMRELRKGRF